MDRTLYLLRGVSGAGKTTLAKTLELQLPDTFVVAADDYFYKDGKYLFDQDKLASAHRWCKSVVDSAMICGVFQNIIVHNTLTSRKELKPYLELAEKHKFKIVSLIVENRHGSESVHDVPDHVIERQAARLKQNIRLY